MRNNIIMVYPLLGMSGSFVKHAPIGLLYAASEVAKEGYDVCVVDARLYPKNWRDVLAREINEDTLLVGISVMTGKPILGALDIGQFVKEIDPQVKVVWGGPFATFHPDKILRDDANCDFVISGYGSKPMAALVRSLIEGTSQDNIPGLYYRAGGGVHFTASDWSCHEFIDHEDIPYQLIEDYGVYGQLDQEKNIFSIYSAMGCVYNCAFCSSPALYQKIKGPHWVPYDISSIVDHVELAVNKYEATYIYFIDDDSFVSLQHVERVIDEINRRAIKIKLGFRGARINEIKKMSHEFIDKLVMGGTDILHIGAESGSNRILNLVRKNCSREDIIEINRKLAKHPDIQPFYNFIIGLPTETLAELKETSSLMLQLAEENPQAIIGIPNKYRPLPGTELFELAKKEWGYTPPEKLFDFVKIEVEGDFDSPWFPKDFRLQCDMMLVTSYFIDNKIFKVTSGNTLFYQVLRLASRVYAPIARFRLRKNFTRCLIELYLYRLASALLTGSQQVAKRK